VKPDPAAEWKALPKALRNAIASLAIVRDCLPEEHATEQDYQTLRIAARAVAAACGFIHDDLDARELQP
jgi:hypothetical protein